MSTKNNATLPPLPPLPAVPSAPAAAAQTPAAATPEKPAAKKKFQRPQTSEERRQELNERGLLCPSKNCRSRNIETTSVKQLKQGRTRYKKCRSCGCEFETIEKPVE